MNFKRYHVSKNLFDKTSEYVVGTTTYNYTISGLDPNKDYTCSTNFVKTVETASVYFNGGISTSNGVWSDTPRTFRPNSSGEIVVYLRYKGSDGAQPIIDDVMAGTIWVMVNEGGQPLPYEPYSSEVWHDTPHYIHNTATDTITTLPAVLYPTGATATIGLKGQMEQSGTPTPTTPIQPQECGELEENVAIIDNRSDTITNSFYKDIRLTDVLKAGTYTVSYSFNSRTGNAYTSSIGRGNSDTYLEDIVNIFVQNIPAKIVKTVTLTKDECIWARFLRGATPSTFSYNVSNIRVEEGNVSYGIKIPISSANTTTPVYLGEVETTRKIGKLVLTGEEANWLKSSKFKGNFYNAILYTPANTMPILCSHAVYTSKIDETAFVYGKCCVDGGGDKKNLNLYIGESSWTVDEFKAYLAQQYTAGTPVTVWYVLATETTGIVNEPIRKIGDYADTVSGITIPTIAGANTLSVGTTVQPSEVTVNYKGWHPVADVHERDNGAWT